MRFGCFIFTKHELFKIQKTHHKLGNPKETEEEEANEVLAFAVVEFNHQRTDVDTSIKTSEKEHWIEKKDHSCAIIHLVSANIEDEGANMYDERIARVRGIQ